MQLGKVLPIERMRAGWLNSFSSGVKIASSISKTLERGQGHKSRRTGLQVVKLTVVETSSLIDMTMMTTGERNWVKKQTVFEKYQSSKWLRISLAKQTRVS